MRAISTLFLLSAIAPVYAADLNIEVHGVRSTNGQVKLMLFDKAEGFRKEAQARQVLALPAEVGAVQGQFHDLPAGRYAVIAYHDENGNGKLDLRFGMFPKEGYGLSNNPKVSGPPSFAESAFDLSPDGRSIEIKLSY